MSQENKEDIKSAVICGAGIIGASIAYYLSEKGLSATIIERCSPACGASGKAGGFLAADWSTRSKLGPLSAASFALHSDLAEKLGADKLGYRRLHTMSVDVKETNEEKKQTVKHLPWVDHASVGKTRNMGTPETTAQVHPYKLTHALLAAAVEKGCKLQTGCVTGIERDPENRVTGVKLADGSTVPAEVVVIAMGPWSHQAVKWFPEFPELAGISAIKAHSIVMNPKTQSSITAHALFLHYETQDGDSYDPEIYPRSDEVYVCGASDNTPLPENPAAVKPSEGACRKLRSFAQHVSSHLAEAEVKTEQACYLPCFTDDLPLIGALPGIEGGYIATAHSCWGILNGPATGRSVAELIVDGKSTVDLSAFDPARILGKKRRSSRTGH